MTNSQAISFGRCAVSAACLLLALCAGASARAADMDAATWLRPDAVFGQLGAGDHVSSMDIGLAWDWNWQKQLRVGGLLTGYTEVSLGQWRSTGQADDKTFTQAGITPVLRLYPRGATVGWFLEAGIGANAISPRYYNGTRRFSTVFNFGDHLAVGRRFGALEEHELALRVQHFSNCGSSHPNPGENFVQLRYSRHF